MKLSTKFYTSLSLAHEEGVGNSPTSLWDCPTNLPTTYSSHPSSYCLMAMIPTPNANFIVDPEVNNPSNVKKNEYDEEKQMEFTEWDNEAFSSSDEKNGDDSFKDNYIAQNKYNLSFTHNFHCEEKQTVLRFGEREYITGGFAVPITTASEQNIFHLKIRRQKMKEKMDVTYNATPVVASL
ncbi:hypothetical protein J437_LFUL016046 [Ladona fulva]|uniref:Uncharacterized protein n=1 Tax=Ladona fulva TaxID=123851 RepID=A0A8K0KRZ1_LADFU|nr:hypothetical protein J437_LFUL016046 [Ladona fulva]